MIKSEEVFRVNRGQMPNNLQALCRFLLYDYYDFMENCSTQWFTKEERKLVDEDGTFFTVDSSLWQKCQEKDEFFFIQYT